MGWSSQGVWALAFGVAVALGLTAAPEARADVALVYAPIESGRLGRAVTLEEMIAATADLYQREIDEHLGLL